MSQSNTIVLTILFTLAVLVGVTAFVSSRVRRAPSVAAREVTQSEVSFVVCSRRWQSILIRGVGILFFVVGCLLLLVAIVPSTTSSARGAAIPGAIIAIVGILFLWLARGLKRVRLEVTSDSIWVFGWTGAPREVPLSDISRLSLLASSNYGGVVAYTEHGRSFNANRLMLGYRQLIDYFQTRRPDLAIPESSWPL
jgi:hypothetical protein